MGFVYLVIVTLCVVIWISNMVLKVTLQKIKVKGAGELRDFTIAHISDLHGRVLGKENTKVLSAIAAQDPDIVVLTGDMIDGNGENRVFLSLAKSLASRYPVYYIRGNHEQRLSNIELELLLGHVKDTGVIILDNEKVMIDYKGATIALYGLWSNDIYSYDPGEKGDMSPLDAPKIEGLIGKYDANAYNILLVHTPAYFNSYAAWGADLVLCGHMHGGMIRLPLIGGVLSPYRRFFPRYDSGLYTKGNCRMYVSRGVGNGKIGFRFLNCPELVFIRCFEQEKNGAKYRF